MFLPENCEKKCDESLTARNVEIGVCVKSFNSEVFFSKKNDFTARFLVNDYGILEIRPDFLDYKFYEFYM